jgi:hypothetical protein
MRKPSARRATSGIRGLTVAEFTRRKTLLEQGILTPHTILQLEQVERALGSPMPADVFELLTRAPNATRAQFCLWIGNVRAIDPFRTPRGVVLESRRFHVVKGEDPSQFLELGEVLGAKLDEFAGDGTTIETYEAVRLGVQS